MHYQVVVNPTDAAKVMRNQPGISIYPNSSRWIAKIPEFGEEIVYDVYPDKIVVIREATDGEELLYDANRDYNFRTLPFMIGIVCHLHNRRIVEVGSSRHAVVCYSLNGEGRFRVSSEDGKVTLHEKDGLIFTQEENCYVAVPDEVIASIYIARMGHSLKLFSESYLVRFEQGGRYLYYPWSEVYGNAGLREMRYREIPETSQLDWEGMAKRIEDHVDHFTASGIGVIK